ncbi:trihelix transcription factor ASR3-like isoform X1 [Actinidia eriantha]|uniref:trihelix transcription factor ASR3-like isoform X1 n=1 Tax=Actinidia eriantha TaxID=165200 RepID=UPI0025827912|nr:trihelix transcription factor ASR3-like isoform X1 [Actinidia eriantha]
MALERLSLGSAPVDAVPNGGDDRKSTGDDGHRAPRLPRWTRQEILVLIQGKRVAENRGRRGRTVGMAFGAGQVEPKWASVSSYCKRHGVNRGPVQCRKRWSNLAGDYKKIKEWESHIREESESFWAMRNDLRRERKLPGFFDREVYDILDGGTIPSVTPTGLALALAPSKEEVEAEAVFDSGRSAAAEDGLFSDFEQSAQEEAGGDSPGKDSPPAKEVRTTTVPDSIPISGQIHGKRQASDPETGATSEEGHKQRRFGADRDEETNTLQCQLIKVLEKNGRMVCAQLESQNTNSQLDREQRKDHANSLVAVLNKLADALGRIADKV